MVVKQDQIRNKSLGLKLVIFIQYLNISFSFRINMLTCEVDRELADKSSLNSSHKVDMITT